MDFDLADDSTTYTANTPPESIAADSKDDYDHVETAEPRSGSTFIIRSVLSGDVITLSDGLVTLSSPDSHGCNEWVCVEDRDGWLGFRNGIAGRFLGYGKDWTLCCAVTWHQKREKFRALKRGGGYILIMPHWWYGSQPVGIKQEGNVKKLVMVKSWESEEAIWAFDKVSRLPASVTG
jgi:hypothetical protein